MNKVIAERRLLIESIEDGQRKELLIRIGEPYWDSDLEMAMCPREYLGLLPEIPPAAGIDGIQAIFLATEVDSVLETQSEKYRFFYPNGEPYEFHANG